MALDRDLQLNALLGITQAINNNLSEDDLFRIYKFTLLGDLKVAKMALFVWSNGKWEYRIHLGTEFDWTDYELDDRFDNIKDEFSCNPTEGHFGEFQKVFPILHKEKVLALLFMSEVEVLFRSKVEDLTFVKALTNIIIVAVENKRMARAQQAQEAYKKELEIANKIQHFLFPKTLPNSPEIKVEAFYLPHHNVGGDYYDYLKISEEKFLICVADVSGKGVPAALLMSNFQATLRVLIRRTDNLEEIVRELNRSTYLSGNGEHFITFFLGTYDFGSKKFEYINCGHNPLYIVKNRACSSMNKGTTVLGMFEPLPFLESETISDLDEFVFFGFTDGLTETFNEEDEQFGEERLEDMLCNTSDASMLHNSLLQELDAFRGSIPYSDDITMLTCQVVNN
ncbi:MAG: PP2C family protein-serine/threonine phosphatase [Cytophagales bacterium]|nr:PP2C family protein-serine/threonine phosphatase [Cytophagales bacterium]